MPNYCNYEMKVRGKRENVEEFKQIMRNYDLPHHFHRVFAFDDVMEYEEGDGIVLNHIIGSCAWSVYCCMCEGPETYQNDNPEASTSMQKESERLNLEIEVYSNEPGIGFQEHYHYKNGETISDECLDCIEYYFEEEVVEKLLEAEEKCTSDEERRKVFNKWKKKNNFPSDMKRDVVVAEERYRVGGFDTWNFFCD